MDKPTITQEDVKELIASGKIYIIDNIDQGIYQIAWREGEEPNTGEDPCWEAELHEFC